MLFVELLSVAPPFTLSMLNRAFWPSWVVPPIAPMAVRKLPWVSDIVMARAPVCAAVIRTRSWIGS